MNGQEKVKQDVCINGNTAQATSRRVIVECCYIKTVSLYLVVSDIEWHKNKYSQLRSL